MTTARRPLALTVLGLALLSSAAAQDALSEPDAPWPQGPGPNGDWSAEGPAPPLRFSVRSGENVRWRTKLPETGQGGIAVAGGRVYVATMAPWDPANALSEADAKKYEHATEKRTVVGTDIDAHCVDAETGAILWTRRIVGEVPAIYTYPFSDATSASPVTDGERVWFTNASGRVVCFTKDGEMVWERRFTPSYTGPFNKQFEPFLIEVEGIRGPRKVLLHMEPNRDDPGDEDSGEEWHHVLGLDAANGAVLWRSQDALTQYNAPTLVDVDGKPHLLHGRGGPHEVPERPVGVSLTKLFGDIELPPGERVWRYEDPRGNHEASLQTMAHDGTYAYWILKEPRNALVVLDLATGEEVREISLVEDVTRTTFDQVERRWTTETGVDLKKGVFPARYSMIAANGHVFFQCYATAWGKPTIGPAYSFGRVDPASGAVEYLEVPTDRVLDVAGSPSYAWRIPRVARPINGRGEDVTGDERSRWDGWDWVFNGSPTRVNDWLYFTLASGVVYVLDAGSSAFDGRALLALNDVGDAGETWTANSISYADGRLYHRTGAELICVGL